MSSRTVSQSLLVVLLASVVLIGLSIAPFSPKAGFPFLEGPVLTLADAGDGGDGPGDGGDGDGGNGPGDGGSGPGASGEFGGGDEFSSRRGGFPGPAQEYPYGPEYYCSIGYAEFCPPAPEGLGGPPAALTVDLKVNGSDGPLTFEALAGYTAGWTTANATSCTASDSWSNGRPVSGTEGFSDIARGSYSYTLTCTGPGGQSSDAVEVSVIEVPQCTVAPTPGSIILPETSTLTWSCQFADSCVIDQGIGAVNPVSGNREVQPQETTTYTLTCQGADGPRNFPATVRVFSPSLREILPR